MADKRKDESFFVQIRRAVADYIYSEGCSCCRGSDHGEHSERLAKLLRVPKHDDGSGRDFYRFRSELKAARKGSK